MLYQLNCLAQLLDSVWLLLLNVFRCISVDTLSSPSQSDLLALYCRASHFGYDLTATTLAVCCQRPDMGGHLSSFFPLFLKHFSFHVTEPKLTPLPHPPLPDHFFNFYNFYENSSSATSHLLRHFLYLKDVLTNLRDICGESGYCGTCSCAPPLPHSLSMRTAHTHPTPKWWNVCTDRLCFAEGNHKWMGF